MKRPAARAGPARRAVPLLADPRGRRPWADYPAAGRSASWPPGDMPGRSASRSRCRGPAWTAGSGPGGPAGSTRWPPPRQVTPRTPAEVLSLAAAVKRENPARTAAQVARVLRASGGWSPSERTLQRHFVRLELATRRTAPRRRGAGRPRPAADRRHPGRRRHLPLRTGGDARDALQPARAPPAGAGAGRAHHPPPLQRRPPPYLPAAQPRRPRIDQPAGTGAAGRCCSCAPPTRRARTWRRRCGAGPATSRRPRRRPSRRADRARRTRCREAASPAAGRLRPRHTARFATTAT